MGKFLLVLFMFTCFSALSQEPEPKDLFSQAVGKNIRKYRVESRHAYRTKDEERAQFLFDSLIQNVINGTHLDNFKVRKFSGRRIELYKFEKPIYLITYASWCVPGIGEIPALNDIADDNYNDIDFVVLFWGSKKKIRKFKKKYSKRIHVLYIDERENRNDFAIRSMKHSVGFPTSFLIKKDKKILDVRRNHFDQYDQDYSASYNANYQSFMGGVSALKKELLSIGKEIEPNF